MPHSRRTLFASHRYKRQPLRVALCSQQFEEYKEKPSKVIAVSVVEKGQSEFKRTMEATSFVANKGESNGDSFESALQTAAPPAMKKHSA